MPKIAAIILNYNDSRFLINIVNKMCLQGFDEVIVVDDLSTDNSLKLLLELKKQFKIKVLPNVTKGVFNAFIRACEITTCDYVTGWSCDDEPMFDYYEKMRMAITAYPFVDMYSCNSIVQKENEKYDKTLLPFTAFISPQYACKLFKSGHNRAINYIGNVYTKDLILKCWQGGGDKMEINFDDMFSLYAMFSKGFINLKYPLVLYRSYSNGFGNSGKLSRIIKANKYRDEFLKVELDHKGYELFLESTYSGNRYSFVSRLSLMLIRYLPKFIRRKVYQWYYRYDQRREKL